MEAGNLLKKSLEEAVTDGFVDALCGELQVSGRAFEQCDIPGHKEFISHIMELGKNWEDRFAASLEIQETYPGDFAVLTEQGIKDYPAYGSKAEQQRNRRKAFLSEGTVEVYQSDLFKLQITGNYPHQAAASSGAAGNQKLTIS